MARILYIDDCHRDRTFVSIALRGLGHEFADAADGADAIELARSFSPDCIVVNPSVPVLCGSQLVGRLEKLAPNAVLVVLGCGLREQTIKAAIDAGAHACLSRPFGIDELVDTIDRALESETLGAA